MNAARIGVHAKAAGKGRAIQRNSEGPSKRGEPVHMTYKAL